MRQPSQLIQCPSSFFVHLWPGWSASDECHLPKLCSTYAFHVRYRSDQCSSPTTQSAIPVTTVDQSDQKPSETVFSERCGLTGLSRQIPWIGTGFQWSAWARRTGDGVLETTEWHTSAQRVSTTAAGEEELESPENNARCEPGDGSAASFGFETRFCEKRVDARKSDGIEVEFVQLDEYDSLKSGWTFDPCDRLVSFEQRVYGNRWTRVGITCSIFSGRRVSLHFSFSNRSQGGLVVHK